MLGRIERELRKMVLVKAVTEILRWPGQRRRLCIKNCCHHSRVAGMGQTRARFSLITVLIREEAPKRFFQSSVQELCESRGGRPGLSVLMSLTVSVDVKQH